MKVFITIIMFFSGYGLCLADVLVSIPDNLNMPVTDTEVTIPVHLSGVTNENISGFILRLDYDESVLSNPEISTSGTLSQGLPVKGAAPVDIFGGKFSIGLMTGLQKPTDGVLLNIRFKVSDNFVASPVYFITEKTAFHTSTFSPIAGQNDGSFIIRSASHQLSTIDFDETFMYNPSANVEGTSYQQSSDVQLSISGDISQGNYIISGDNNLSSMPVISIQEKTTKALLKRWYIISNSSVSDVTLTFNMNLSSINPEYYWLSGSSDNENFSEICHADRVDVQNNQIIFLLPDEISQRGYYTLTFKDFLTDLPELYTSFQVTQFKSFNYIAWRATDDAGLIGFNIFRKQLGDEYFAQVNTSMIPVNDTRTFSYKDTDLLSDNTFFYGLEYIYENQSQHSFIHVSSDFSMFDVNQDLQVDMGDVLSLIRELSLGKSE